MALQLRLPALGGFSSKAECEKACVHDRLKKGLCQKQKVVVDGRHTLPSFLQGTPPETYHIRLIDE